KPLTNITDDVQTLALKQALKENRIALFRQPIVTSTDGSIVRFECLARMINVDGTIANAADFIPAAERAGLIADLDIAALNLALAALKGRADLQLAVNVSAATIADFNARQEFENMLKHSRNEAGYLTVEITETIAIQDLDVAAKFAAKVRVNNARVALDDFGSGHTSFRSLKAIPLDEVKIDGHYVEKIHERGDSRAFVKAIQSLSHDLGLETIAERVETETEAAILRDIGIFGLQGYLFGRPQAA
ncbi:MAG: PAS/PAC sensor-containing diguanylate cyclase/phosphodiesterase, partial [Hyphomonadaceae bacterium]